MVRPVRTAMSHRWLIVSLRAALRPPEGTALVLGNGSDEIIQLLTTLVARPQACIVAPDPSFVMYRNNARFAGVRFVGVPLRADFSLDVEAMIGAIESERPALVWIAYPNNPTGNLFAEEDVLRVIAAAPGLVVVDEAYHAFAGASFLPRVGELPNLLLLRTVSKIGMAGLRLGYAVAPPAWIDELDKLRQPYNLNALTQAVAPLLLAETALLAEQAALICSERARLQDRIGCLPGVRAWPTRANFVLARVPDAPRWFATLREAGILVKNLHGGHPLLQHCLRITVGTPQENDALLAVLEGQR